MKAIEYENSLNDFLSLKQSASSVELGHMFLEWSLLKLFNRTETELENDDIKDGVLFTDGTKDYGVDCAFVDGDTLYLIQGKYRSNHSYENVYFFKEQISKFLALKDAKNIRSKLVDVYSKLQEEHITKINIFYLTNNYLEQESQNHGYEQLAEEFEEQFSAILGKEVKLQILGYEGFYKIHTGLMLELPLEAKTARHLLTLDRYFENRDKTTIVAEIALKNLARMVDQHKKYIFYSNIRNYKGLNKINKGIKNTYDEHPKNFWYYNNGITVVCKDYQIGNDGNSISVIAPQIVNGCQTATTIYNCWRSGSQYERENVDGTILVKIIKDSKNTRRKDITKYTNSQTAVSGKDFFALEDFHKELQMRFNEYGYFYEIQSNSSKFNNKKYLGSEKYQHLFDQKFKKNNVVNAKEIAQIYIATFLDKPAKAKNIGEFMPGGDRYGQVFNAETSSDPRFYLLPFGVWYYLKNVYMLPESKVLDKDKWSATLLFATNIFFKLIYKAYAPSNVEVLSEDFISLCEDKITDKDIFENIVPCVYNTVKDFYKDTVVRNIIGDNLPKFLKSTIESNDQIKEILADKIDAIIEEMP